MTIEAIDDLSVSEQPNIADDSSSTWNGRDVRCQPLEATDAAIRALAFLHLQAQKEGTQTVRKFEQAICVVDSLEEEEDDDLNAPDSEFDEIVALGQSLACETNPELLKAEERIRLLLNDPLHSGQVLILYKKEKSSFWDKTVKCFREAGRKVHKVGSKVAKPIRHGVRDLNNFVKKNVSGGGQFTVASTPLGPNSSSQSTPQTFTTQQASQAMAQVSTSLSTNSSIPQDLTENPYIAQHLPPPTPPLSAPPASYFHPENNHHPRELNPGPSPSHLPLIVPTPIAPIPPMTPPAYHSPQAFIVPVMVTVNPEPQKIEPIEEIVVTLPSAPQEEKNSPSDEGQEQKVSLVAEAKEVAKTGIVWTASELVHEVYNVYGVLKVKINQGLDFIDRHFNNTPSDSDQKSREQKAREEIQAGHAKIDAMFNTYHAYKYDPNKHHAQPVHGKASFPPTEGTATGIGNPSSNSQSSSPIAFFDPDSPPRIYGETSPNGSYTANTSQGGREDSSPTSQSSSPVALLDPDAPARVYEETPPPPKSTVFEISGTKLQRGCIGGINGIGNNLEEAQANAQYLSQLAQNHHLEWTHNCSHSLLTDVAEVVLLNYQGYSAPAKLLKENWEKFHEEHKNDPNAKYLQYCHSQGAIHVRNALLNAPKEIRDRIIVVAIAPAAIVPKDLCFDSFNYASKGDPIPFGEAAFQVGWDAPPVQTIEMLYQEAHKELILLDPHPDAPAFDHSFTSPTFKGVIERHLGEYIKQYGIDK